MSYAEGRWLILNINVRIVFEHYDTTVGVSECPQCNKQHDVTKDDMPKSGERNLVEGQS